MKNDRIFIDLEDDTKDPFEEYQIVGDISKRERSYAWYTAIGLQAVDGLKTSEYLKDTAVKSIEGKISLDEAQSLIESYYKSDRKTETPDTQEADIVSSRIATILSENGFTFSVAQYLSIHGRLFEGIYDHAGKIRDYNITKKEWVLDGDTVTYGNALDLSAMLEYDIAQEKAFSYSGLTKDEIVGHLAKFVSNLWQIHVFGEGNTRTTAVFFIKYLRTLGFDVTNDIFAKNAWYFRNAMVRANYNGLQDDVSETTEYLELFLRNLLYGENNELKNRTLHIRWGSQNSTFGTQKQHIDLQNSTFSTQKQHIDRLIAAGLSAKSANNTMMLYSKFGEGEIFGRTEVVETLNITERPASTLLKKLLDAGIIEQVKGKGKGKYKFCKF
ncbi:MAG: Fic family protein [Clostridia bacterium]|nr:Fic family protein [Clostridia bacterium]